MEDTKERNYKEIELLRGFAVLAVIMIHVTGRSMDIKEFNNTMLIFRIILAFSGFAVPLFFVISGFTLSIKFYNDYSISLFYRKRFKNIVPPYIIFSIVYIFFYSYYFMIPLNMLPLKNLYNIMIKAFTAHAPLRLWYFRIIAHLIYYNLNDVIIEILTARTSMHLWYFRIIFQFYLFYPFVKNLICKFKNYLLALLATSLIIQIVWVGNSISINNFLFKFISSQFLVYLSYHSIISYIFYFIFGTYIYYYYDRLLSICAAKMFNNFNIILMICFGIIRSYFQINDLLIEKFSLLSNLTIFYTVAITMLFLNICIHLKSINNLFVRILFKFGQYSFGIYLIHVMIILITEWLLIKYLNVDFYEWYFYPICFFITAGLSLPLTYLISLMPYHELLIGKVRRWEISD